MIPRDPQAFVSAAERLSNAYDWRGCLEVYAENAVLESVTNNTLEQHEGRAAIGRAWRVYLEVLRRVGLRLEKRLLVASGDTIVNEWTGRLGDGGLARGIERWVFDDRSLVREHSLFTFLRVRPSSDRRQRLQLLLAYPRLALAFFAESRGRGDGERG